MPARAAGIEVRGGPELARAFARLEDRLEDLDPPARDSTELVAVTARSLVPVQSGALRGTIRAEKERDGAWRVTAGSFLVPYAGPIHYGWRARGIEPQPFLTDALAADTAAVERVYDEHIDNLVRRFDREAP